MSARRLNRGTARLHANRMTARSSTEYTVDVFEAFDLNIFADDSTPSPSYWRGAVRRGPRTVARTDRHQTRAAAEREVLELLAQFGTAVRS